MSNDMVSRLHPRFEEMVHVQEGIEFWYARDLQVLLGYSEWRNFLAVIEKARQASRSSKYPELDHFARVNKMVSLGSGSKRQIEDITCTRYACYLIAQNGDPRKEEIAFAQSYFAVQTRKQERIEEHIRLSERLHARKKLTESETELSRNLYERGVTDSGFARIRSRGDAALFGGYSTQEMKDRLNVPAKKPLACLSMGFIAAHDPATGITNCTFVMGDMQGEEPITTEHVRNNQDVRDLLIRRVIVPENPPPEEDLKKLERKAKSSEKRLASTSGLSFGGEE